MKQSIIVLLILGLLALIGYTLWSTKTPTVPVITPVTTGSSTVEHVAKVTFLCQNNRAILADFIETTEPGTTTVNGSVALTLSDGRSFNLPHAMSGSGARFATSGESFVFWNKGNSALVTENNVEKDFTDCVVVATDETNAQLPKTYLDPESRFTLRLPSLGTTSTSTYFANAKFEYAVDASSRTSGVSFTIPATVATGTNLSKDSFISIEQIATGTCSANSFLSSTSTETSITDAGTDYSLASSSDAGAGNRYREVVYAIPGTSPCTAIRYSIHSTVLENYPTGTVTAFDEMALVRVFDTIRRSLTLNQ